MANYLYNGVELPPLPEWDKTAYPYVWISNMLDFVTNARPFVMFSPTPLRVVAVDGGTRLHNSTDSNLPTCDLDTSTFESWTPIEMGYGGSNHSVGHTAQPPNLLIWSNHDILNEDGTIRYSASYPIDAESGLEIHDYDPIPVGGEPIDHTAMVQGWIVGKRLAAMRGKISVDITDAVVVDGELYIINANAMLNDVELEVF